MKTKGDLLKAAIEIGVSQGTLYAWKKLPEYPTGTLAEQFEFVKCRKLGRAALTTSKPSAKQKRGKPPTDSAPDNDTNWKLEKLKWDTREKQQKVESERLKILQAGRELLLDGVAEILAIVQKRMAAEFKGNPIQARRVNEIYADALKELGSIQQN